MPKAAVARCLLLVCLLFVLAGCGAGKAEVTAYLAGWKSVDDKSKAVVSEMEAAYPKLLAKVEKRKLTAKDVAAYDSKIAGWQKVVREQTRALESLPVLAETGDLQRATLELLDANNKSLDQTLLLITLCGEVQARQRQGQVKGKRGKSKLEPLREELQSVLASLGQQAIQAEECSAKVREALAKLQSDYSLELSSLQPVPPSKKARKKSA